MVRSSLTICETLRTVSPHRRRRTYGRAVQLLVLAKEPIPGLVKTRLCPPLTHGQAAQVTEACLADTLEAAVATGADRVVLILAGTVGDWCPPGVDVVAQTTGSLGERLAHAWAAVDGPAVQIGMDTPQVTSAQLDAAMARLADPADGCPDALLGHAEDGGWWLLGLRRWIPGAFTGVAMSTPTTGASQHARLLELGMFVESVATLRDIDTVKDLAVVAAAAPHTRVASMFRTLQASSPSR